MADTVLFLSWDVIWGHNDPRVTALKDDAEGLRRHDQAVEAARRVWESWFLRSMGAAVNYDGAAGRAQVPVDQIGDIDDVRRQIKDLLDADVGVGIGLKISEADLALKLALKRGGTVVFYTEDVPKALEDLEKGGLQKADAEGPESPQAPAPKKVAENSPAAGGGFSGAQQPGGAADAAPPAGEASDHSQGEAAASAAEDAPGPQETTHAGADFEKQFQDAADSSDADEQSQQAQTEDGRKAADLKEAVVSVLKGLRQQAPVLEQLQILEPQLFQAISGLMKAMLLMAKELVGVAPVKKAEDKIEADPSKPPEVSADLVKDAVPDAAQGLDVDHYSTHPDLKTVDPHFQGTGSAGPEKQRKQRIPRSYFYARGTKPEAHVAANAHLYHGRVPAGTKLYDFSEDPDDYLTPRWEQTDDGQMYRVPDLDEVEKDLHTRGFHGYRNYGPDGALALFHALPVTRATVKKMDDMPALPPPEGNLKSEGCKHFYGRGGTKCLRCKEEKIEKAKLPLPENAPKHVQHVYPVGAVKDSSPGGTRDVGKVKVFHPDSQKTGWVEVRAGQVMSQDGHPISSRNPGGK